MDTEFSSVINGVADLNGIEVDTFFALPRSRLESINIPLPALGKLLKFYDDNKPKGTGMI